jgi:hypothetical protein
MTTSIENRIEKLEARLLPTNTVQDTIIIHIVGRSGQTDVIDIYRDSDGHTLRRNQGESGADFEERAKQWIWREHPPADPRSILSLIGLPAGS